MPGEIQGKKNEVIVDGASMKVSENLLEALLQFRADDNEESQLYWIDAVSFGSKQLGSCTYTMLDLH